MRTIGEAAKEYADKRYDGRLLHPCAMAGFEAGVKWAQEWIPVDIEPEENRTYLIRDKNNMIGLATWNGYWNYKHAKTITHWRPINKK
jgi:hypothetical protein